MRRENCLDNCKLIFHISPVECPNSAKIFALCLLKNCVLFQSWRVGIVLLGVANGCYLWKKKCFCWWTLIPFFTPLSSVHLLCWRPTGFSGDFDTTRVVACRLWAVRWGLCAVRGRSISLGSGGGNCLLSGLGCWVVTLCSWPSPRERLEHGELLLRSFLKEHVGLIIGVLSSHFSKSHFFESAQVSWDLSQEA